MDKPRKWSVPASPGRVNEDAVFSSSGVAVVVDGAGLPHSMRAGCHHSVAWYSHQLAERFGRALLATGLTMRKALSRAITEVAQLHDGCRLTEGSPSATVAAWRLQPSTLEYLVLCDASALVVMADQVVEITDDRLSALMAEPSSGAVADGAGRRSAAEIRQARAAVLQGSRNVDGGYWCCQIDPAAADQALIGTYPLSDVQGIVIATDGATRGFQSLGVHTAEEFARRAVTGDATALLNEIRAAEHRQRRLLLNAASKVHDDATLVALATAGKG